MMVRGMHKLAKYLFLFFEEMITSKHSDYQQTSSQYC